MASSESVGAVGELKKAAVSTAWAELGLVSADPKQYYWATITWAGPRSVDDRRQMLAGLEEMFALFKGAVVTAGDRDVFGPPSRIAEGAGLVVRKLTVGDAVFNEHLQAFHRQWYTSSAGEDEERKKRTVLHFTVGKNGVTEPEIMALGSLNVAGVALREKDSSGTISRQITCKFA